MPCNHKNRNDSHHDYGPDQPLYPIPKKITKPFITPKFVGPFFVFNIRTFFESSRLFYTFRVIRLRFQIIWPESGNFFGAGLRLCLGHELRAFAA